MTRPTTQQRQLPWLFSPTIDLLTFLGSALLALLLLGVGAVSGVLEQETPEWAWVGAVLLVDVAHVYATGFRVYFDRKELANRPWLYSLTPLLAFLIGAAVYSESPTWFWRTLAYLAVFHFVRQQYGWVALYRARGGEQDRVGYWVDSAAIYLATIYPLVEWHARLPRNFWWFLEGDFTALPALLATIIQPLYWIALVAYFVRVVYRGVANQEYNPGKDVVVLTTAICWYVGIVSFNSDYAFTVTNVIIHGIPYMVLVFWYRARAMPSRRLGKLSMLNSIATFLGVVWILAFVEEFFWDRVLWQERGWLFGSGWDWTRLELGLVPLLAVPQITHYVLDGFIWRRRDRQFFE